MHRVPNPDAAFARTNVQSLEQRVALVGELCPGARSIGEICAGDCTAQARLYRERLGLERYVAVDVSPAIAARLAAAGIEHICGDALDERVMRPLAALDVLFFGPPLSHDCDGHRLLAFDDVRPAYGAFVELVLGRLAFAGTLVCIAPRSTNLGDARRLHAIARAAAPDVGLRRIHYSWSTVTGHGEATEPRLKYVELWLARGGDEWRTSGAP
ncbi:MAG TPA: hypothetical protein VFF06_30460 [Polyangia bacterium]|nr:hypothetical protein [Polyangia bacterium]